ncbi:MAG: glycosyltransferase domain-containing protein [Planctomycetota bacterium]
MTETKYAWPVFQGKVMTTQDIYADVPDATIPAQKKINIYYSMPWNNDQNVGAYYNSFMKLLGDDDYACFIDGDTIFTTVHYGKQIYDIVTQNPNCRLFTAMTNRVQCKYQVVDGIDKDNNDMVYHRELGEKLFAEKYDEVQDISLKGKYEAMSGVLILIKKSLWKELGGFKDGFLTVDNDIMWKVQAKNEKILLMDGVYLYHWYRFKNFKSQIDRTIKRAVYTAIIGEYDTPPEFTKVPGWKYFIFTNNKGLKSDSAKVIYINCGNDAKNARKIKILASMYLREYDITIWLDGNIRMTINPDELLAKVDIDNNPFVAMEHPLRKCAYEEALACIKLNKDGSEIINNQMLAYKNDGFPKEAGLISSGIIIRRNTPEVTEFCNKWWAEVEKFSRRDQLSFNYTAWKTQFKYKTIEFLLNDSNGGFKKIPHLR